MSPKLLHKVTSIPLWQTPVIRFAKIPHFSKLHVGRQYKIPPAGAALRDVGTYLVSCLTLKKLMEFELLRWRGKM